MLIRRLAQFLLKSVILNPIVLLIVVILSGSIGVAVVYDAPAYAARAARAERLQPLTAAALVDRPAGGEVLLEGQVSPRTAVVYRSFVAYVREAYRSEFSLLGGDSSPRWVMVEQVTPPLVVALADGEARISNDDYLLDTTAFTIREAEPTLTDGAIQSRGYRVGDPVLVVGTIVDADGQPAVDAAFIYAGTRAAYLAEMRSLAQRSLPIGAAFLVLCAASLVALVWQTRRFLREIAAEQAAEGGNEGVREQENQGTREQEPRSQKPGVRRTKNQEPKTKRNKRTKEQVSIDCS